MYLQDVQLDLIAQGFLFGRTSGQFREAGDREDGVLSEQLKAAISIDSVATTTVSAIVEDIVSKQ